MRFKQLKNTVLDTQTGLEWQAQSTESMTWLQAMDYAVSLGNNWRLPTIEELFQLINFQRHSPATDFPEMKSEWFWSSSSYANSSLAWLVFFDSGLVDNNVKNSVHSVRYVRAGPSREPNNTDNLFKNRFQQIIEE